MPATSKVEGRSQVLGLVARFERNLNHYRSPAFDEESTREYFINRLFEALGWDVGDEAGRGPRREVIFHQRLSPDAVPAGPASWDEDLSPLELAVRDAVTIPDYSFNIAGITRFFVEAKKPSVSLRRREPVHQVKRYAYSQQVPFAVLTDFRELRAFNCRERPVYEEPDRGLLPGLDLTWRQYPEAWDRLWETFSRDAVAAGSLDALSNRTARRGAVPVDEAFLRELDVWRDRLARDLAQRNAPMTSYEVADATQRILDRLVFLRVCEDRGVETDMGLQRYARLTDAYHQLAIEFRRLDSVYNGQLFAPHFSERLEVSDGLFQRLVASLYWPAPYRFDAISADLLGSIYERFLGKEITTGPGGVEVIDKPEVRHAGGVYYTPRWIVERIVAATLDPLLAERRTPPTPRTMANLRIVDFSCGSGSFLIGAFDYLLAWHERYYEQHPTENADQHYRDRAGHRKLTTDAKAQLVTNCLYGVDIDRQAVEVTQMSLYLRILEEENASSLGQQARLFHGALLPSLASNIRCGNSLLSPSQVDVAQLFDEERRRRINPFDWRDDKWGFGRVFRDRGGFDAVIGNPPYTRVQVLRRYRPEETAAYEQHYAAARTGSFDIASLFVEKSLDLLRPAAADHRGGRLGLIISRQFVETDAGQPVREQIAPHLSEIVDFTTGQVFLGASVYTLLLHLTAGASRSFRLTRVVSPPNHDALRLAEEPGSILTAELATDSLGVQPWALSLPAETALLERLASEQPSLREVAGDTLFQGVTTGADKIFRLVDVGPDPAHPSCRLVRPRALSAEAPPLPMEAALLRPLCAGRSDLRRFYLRTSNEWLLLPYERAGSTDRYRPISSVRLAYDYPHAWSWLSANRRALDHRTGAWNDRNWFTYSRRQNLEAFEQPKLLVPYMVDQLCAEWDTAGHYFVNVSTGGYGVAVTPDSGLEPRYVAALLNSALASWVLRRRSRAWRGGWFGARKGNLVLIPIAEATAEQRVALIRAYHHCRALTAQLAAATADGTANDLLQRVLASTTAAFDARVFDLYGLTDAERDLVRAGIPQRSTWRC